MAQENVPLWELRNISKSFPGVQALDEVELTLVSGEVHALLGENGSGKSTLCKCLAGAHPPAQGKMLLRGEPVTFDHPLDARSQGVATIYQEFSLVRSLSIAENIFLGRPVRLPRGGVLDWPRMRRETREVLAQLDLDVDPDVPVERLSVAEQQLVEIAKALSIDSSLLIMDEPTAALGLGETRRLLNLIRRLAAQGKAILYVSHRLDEVFEVADVVTILKDGQLVAGRRPVGDLSMAEVVRLMVGTDVADHYPKEYHRTDEPMLEVEHLRTESGVNDVSFTVHRGEVFGLGGMVGSGRTEIARALFGADPRTSGTIRLEEEKVDFSSPMDAIAAGVGLVPENRKDDGLFFNFPAPPNITVARLRQLVERLFLNLRREKEVGQKYVDKLSVVGNVMDRSVEFLSGGNQQKVVIARWLHSQARLLILDEPTRGIDVGAKLDVYNVINELTRNGIAILLISSDYQELLAMSDRIAVIRDGQILHIADAQRLTEYQLTALASGAETSRATLQGMALRETARPNLEALADRVGEHVLLGILEKGERRVLYLEERRVGERLGSAEQFSRAAGASALHATALGKVLLAHAPAPFVERLIEQQGLDRYTPATITDRDTLLAELATIREQGVAFDREEHGEGIGGVAAPIFDAEREVIAAIAARTRDPWDEDTRARLAGEVVDAAASISELFCQR